MEYPQAVVALLMLCVCVLLGIPVWWNTTKVYRAPLPHSHIEELNRTDVRLSIEINIFGDIKSSSQVEEYLRKNSFYEFNFQITTENLDQSVDNNLESLCSKLGTFEESDRLSFNLLLLNSQDKEFLYYCEAGGLGFIIASKSNDFSRVLESLFSSILPLNKEEAKPSDSIGDSLPLSSAYNIVFTLAIAEPNGDPSKWDIEKSIKQQLDPLLEKLNFLGPFHVSSQVLYYTDIGIEPRKFAEGNQSYHFFSKSKIPLIINPLESRLNTYTSIDAGLNFIIYIPPVKYTPLYIKTKKASTKLNTAFHSPRWGGIQIYNPPFENVSAVTVPTENFMDVFMMQFQLLNGLDAISNAKLFPKNEKAPLTKGMQTRVMISKIFGNLKTSISTLSSLSKLLDNIANIVIRDDIKDLIDVAVLNIELTFGHLQEGKIENAMATSKIAFSNSEKAFYDQSLLALLYFPDDQKYAIYVPLFLPISLPIFLSFFTAVKFFRKKNKVE